LGGLTFVVGSLAAGVDLPGMAPDCLELVARRILLARVAEKMVAGGASEDGS
jgi:hypothetical protein